MRRRWAVVIGVFVTLAGALVVGVAPSTAALPELIPVSDVGTVQWQGCT